MLREALDKIDLLSERLVRMAVLGALVSDRLPLFQRFPQILNKIMGRFKVFFLDRLFFAVIEKLSFHHKLALVIALSTLDAGLHATFIQIYAGTLHTGAIVFTLLHLGF